MASSSSVSEDLTCSICLTIFNDPVTILCGHSFCRECITLSLKSQQQCPQCRTVFPEERHLTTNHILKSLAEKAKEKRKERGDDKEMPELCPEHEEKLKLFCITDQKLVCIICRDGEQHQGHQFKPVKEAAAALRKELETFLPLAADDINAIERLSDAQREEIRQTKETSEQLMTQIRRQFEQMQQFLRKREDEIKTELRLKETDGVEKMTEVLNAIEAALSESRELESKAASALKTTDPEQFLKTWTQETGSADTQRLFRPRAKELQLVSTSLSMGPYESHLQFFVWKEMLQMIRTRPEQLMLRSNGPNIAVSNDGRRLFWKTKKAESGLLFGSNKTKSFGFGSSSTQNQSFPFSTPRQTQSSGFGSFSTPNQTLPVFGSNQTSSSGFNVSSTGNAPVELNNAYSVSKFTSGQHYWEIEVGNRSYWELGIKDRFLRYDGQKYSSCSTKLITKLKLENRPRKIGIYLNSSGKKLSFYDADNMAHIHTTSEHLDSTLAYFRIEYSEPDLSPLTVCWY